MSDRLRRPHGELRHAMYQYLCEIDRPASIPEIVRAVEPAVGTAPSSSYRSALQDTRFFERVERGVFKRRDREE